MKNSPHFKIPFTIGSLDRNRKKSKFFQKIFKHKIKSKIQKYLDESDTDMTREEYLGICLRNAIFWFIRIYVISSTIFFLIGLSRSFLLALPLAILFGGFIFFSQSIYPKIFSSRKQRNIERNLIPALEDMLVQLSSGIPLFSIMVNISASDYGFLSLEFKKAVRRINAGIPQMDVIEEMGERNSSLFFRRTLWQISNGMRAGSDISIVINESIQTLTDEQLIQIQNYGNKLNPLIMFYMLTSVIIPALAITFLTIISSYPYSFLW